MGCSPSSNPANTFLLYYSLGTVGRIRGKLGEGDEGWLDRPQWELTRVGSGARDTQMSKFSRSPHIPPTPYHTIRRARNLMAGWWSVYNFMETRVTFLLSRLIRNTWAGKVLRLSFVVVFCGPQPIEWLSVTYLQVNRYLDFWNHRLLGTPPHTCDY